MRRRRRLLQGIQVIQAGSFCLNSGKFAARFFLARLMESHASEYLLNHS